MNKIFEVDLNNDKVKVFARFRPLINKEIQLQKQIAIDYQDKQNEIFEHAAKPIVESVLDGFNGTIFAYGQTSSGKTHTMTGSLQGEDAGIIPRMINQIYERIKVLQENQDFVIKVSVVEIYMEKIKDLINPKLDNLLIREDKIQGIYIQDVQETITKTEKDVDELIKIATQNRTVAASLMNEVSSRSHMLFIMKVQQQNKKDLSSKIGKLCLVDLAGSEKVAKSGATGQLLDEAKRINQSLSTLGKVIYALTDKNLYIPYRDSKLTRVLSESLGGNSKTTLIITCSPSQMNYSESISTLRFGTRAKNIKNHAKQNRDISKIELEKLLNEEKRKNEELKFKLLQFQQKNGQKGFNQLNLGNEFEGFLKEKDLLETEKMIFAQQKSDFEEELKQIEELDEMKVQYQNNESQMEEQNRQLISEKHGLQNRIQSLEQSTEEKWQIEEKYKKIIKLMDNAFQDKEIEYKQQLILLQGEIVNINEQKDELYQSLERMQICYNDQADEQGCYRKRIKIENFLDNQITQNFTSNPETDLLSYQEELGQLYQSKLLRNSRSGSNIAQIEDFDNISTNSSTLQQNKQFLEKYSKSKVYQNLQKIQNPLQQLYQEILEEFDQLTQKLDALQLQNFYGHNNENKDLPSLLKKEEEMFDKNLSNQWNYNNIKARTAMELIQGFKEKFEMFLMKFKQLQSESFNSIQEQMDQILLNKDANETYIKKLEKKNKLENQKFQDLKSKNGLSKKNTLKIIQKQKQFFENCFQNFIKIEEELCSESEHQQKQLKQVYKQQVKYQSQSMEDEEDE